MQQNTSKNISKNIFIQILEILFHIHYSYNKHIVLLKNRNFIKNEYLKLQAKYKDVVLLKLQKSIKI